MSQTFKTVDVLKLEVEDPTPAGLVNRALNPDGRLGSWSWLAENVTLQRASIILGSELVPRDILRTTGAPGGVQVTVVTAARLIPIKPGQWVAATYVANGDGVSGGGYNRGAIAFAAEDGVTPVGSIHTSPVYAASANLARSVSAVQAPAGAAFVQFGVYEHGSSTPTHPVAGQRMWLRDVTVAVASTAAELAGLTYIDPVQYRNVLNASTSIAIDRQGLSAGTMTVSIVDPSLDPTQDDIIRPGRMVRCLALGPDGWEPLFLGKITDGSVAYRPSRRADQRARISFEAVDQVSELANIQQPNGVATIDELPALFPAPNTGLKWKVNGWSGQRAGDVVATTPGASLLDQIAMTRDTALGYAWVDRAGRVQVWDRDEISTTIAALLTEDDYNAGAAISYSTNDLINEVTVKFRRVNQATGETVEVAYGPYRDEDSIAAWGASAREFTIQGAVDNPTAVAAYAQTILAANATPQVRISSLTVPVTKASDISPARALLDLYDRVRIRNRQLPLRGNILPNGSFEPGVVPDNVGEIYVGLVAITTSDTEKHSGERSLVIDPGGEDYRGLIIWPSTDRELDTFHSDQEWTGSCWVKGPAGRILDIGFRWRSASSSYLGEATGYNALLLDGGWQRLITGPAVWDTTPGYEDVQPGIQVKTAPSGWAPGEVFYVDDMQIEPGAVATPYEQRTEHPLFCDSRIAGIKHTITPEKWLVSLSFGDLGAVASPREAPSVNTTLAADASPVWHELTHAGTGGTVRYAVGDGDVTVQLNAAIAVAAGADVTLVTTGNALPAALRPSQGPYAAIFSGNAVGWFQVTPAGSIVVHASTGAMSTVGGTVTYPLG